MLCTVDHIGHNRACCWHFTCSAAIKHHVANRIPTHKDRIEYIVHSGKLAMPIHNRWADHCANAPVLEPLCPAEQLDHAAPSRKWILVMPSV